jgi:hypothetical protein
MIHYLNTDLDIAAADDLTLLTAALQARGVSPLHVGQSENGEYTATLETDEPFEEPEANLLALLEVIEALHGLERVAWDVCTDRTFDIGYRCGSQPKWPGCFQQELSSQTLRRIADVGASLRLTLYPPLETVDEDIT